MSLTLAQSLSLAVLRNDDPTAVYALVDLLLEERSGRGGYDQNKAITNRQLGMPDGYSVYCWPEFRALCERLGVMYDLRTIDMTIKLPADGLVEVEQRYVAADTSSK